LPVALEVVAAFSVYEGYREAEMLLATEC